MPGKSGMAMLLKPRPQSNQCPEYTAAPFFYIKIKSVFGPIWFSFIKFLQKSLVDHQQFSFL